MIANHDSVEGAHGGGSRADAEVSLSVKVFTWAMVAIAVLGSLLRLASILDNGLWNDELVSLRRATEGWADFAHWYRSPDPHPPLYYLLLRAIRAVTFGLLGETALRIAAAFTSFGGTVLILWLAGIRRGYRVAALVVGALIAVSPTHVYLGAELRMYGLAAAFSLGVLMIVIDWLDASEVRCGRMVSLGAAIAFLGFTHYTGLLIGACVLLSAFLFRLARDRQFDFRLVGAGLIALVMFAPILPVFVEQLEFIEATLYSTKPGEALGFIGWALGGVGFAAFIAAVTALFRMRNAVQRTSTAAIVSLLSAFVMALTMLTLSLVRDLDTFNFGISIIPAIFVVVGLAVAGSDQAPRLLLTLSVVAVVVMVPLTLFANHDPARYEPNRVSTLDAVADALDALGDGQIAVSSLTIVHIDWAATNEYFVDKAQNRYPDAQVIGITIPDRHSLGPFLSDGIADGTLESVLIATRIRLDSNIVPQIPEGVVWEIVDPNVVFVHS